ncbi:MAG: hypothetical protein QM722_01880 [Piscinibacter sp.]
MRHAIAARRLTRAALSGLLLCGTAAMATSSVPERRLYGWFDPAAPTITIDEMERQQQLHRQREAQRDEASTRRSAEAERMSQACYDAASTRQAPAATPSMPAPPAADTVRADLRGLPMEELARRYQDTKDPAIEAAIRQRVMADAAARQAPAAPSPLPMLGQVPGVDQRVAEQMRRAALANDPQVQACLRRAEQHGDVVQPEVELNYFSLDAGTAAPVARRAHRLAGLRPGHGGRHPADQPGVDRPVRTRRRRCRWRRRCSVRCVPRAGPSRPTPRSGAARRSPQRPRRRPARAPASAARSAASVRR